MKSAKQVAAVAWNYARPRVRWRDLILVALIGITYLAAVHYYNASQAAQQRQAQQQRAAQQRQGALLEQRLCTTLSALAALQPPPGSPGNPSRTYLQQQHQVLAELGPDVGCKEAAHGK